VSVPSSWVGRTDAVTKRSSGIYTGKRGAGYEVERSNGKEEQSGGSEKCTTSLGVDSHISESLLIVRKVSDLTFCSCLPSLRRYSKGLQDMLKIRPSSLLILFGCK
jgi:hypothetical protein